MHHSRWHMTSAKNYSCKEEILNTPAAGKLFSMALIDLSTRGSNQIHSSYCMPEGRAHPEPPSPQLFHTLLFCFWVQRWGHLHCLRFSCGHILCPDTSFLINWMLAEEMFSYWSKRAEKKINQESAHFISTIGELIFCNNILDAGPIFWTATREQDKLQKDKNI